jgi:phospholipase/lecithinase/hemolysin
VALWAPAGDQMQGQENTNYQQQQQINRNQAESERNRQEIQRLQRQGSEY